MDIPTATTPRKVIRTEAQAIAETGLRMSSLALYPRQVELLGDAQDLQDLCQPDQAHLYGGPGTGKSVCLALRGMQWMQRGEDVDVVSISRESHAVSILAQNQLRAAKASGPCAGSVHLHVYDFNKPDDVEAAVNKLAALGRSLHLIVDELTPGVR